MSACYAAPILSARAHMYLSLLGQVIRSIAPRSRCEHPPPYSTQQLRTQSPQASGHTGSHPGPAPGAVAGSLRRGPSYTIGPTVAVHASSAPRGQAGPAQRAQQRVSHQQPRPGQTSHPVSTSGHPLPRWQNLYRHCIHLSHDRQSPGRAHVGKQQCGYV